MRISTLLLAWLSLAPLAGAQTPLFQPLDTPIPAAAASLHAAGDLDGDGDADLLVASGILLNDGHGRFSASPVAPVWGLSPTLADFNGDGLLDIASIVLFPVGGVAVHLNAGGLVFTQVAGLLTVPAPAYANNVAAADVDGDGDVDVWIGALQQTGPHSVSTAPASLWLNNGAGSFTIAPAGSVPAIGLPSQNIILRDLDADGDPDALLSNLDTFNGALNLALLQNTGGTFTLIPLPVTGAGAVEVGEVNGDGFPDLLIGVSSGGSISVLLGSATGFSAPVVSPVGSAQFAAIDVNADGKDEILIWQGTDLALHAVASSGAIGPQLQLIPNARFPLFSIRINASKAIADLDGDQDADVVVRSGQEAAVLMNDGAGGLVLAGGHTAGVVFALLQRVVDLDGDGDQDLLGLPNYSFMAQGGVATAFNDGDGSFSHGPTTSLPFMIWQAGIYYSLEPFDRDGDGDADLYCAWKTVSVSGGGGPFDYVYDNAGGAFTLFTTVPSTGQTALFQSADFDGDGDQDVVLGKRTPTYNPGGGIAGPMVYVANQGSTGMGPPVLVGGNHATYDLDLGDFDGNGTVDVLQSNLAAPGAPPDPSVVYLNSGTGTFTAIVQGFSGQLAATADLNGDAMTDLVVDGQVWFSAGGGSFFAGPLLPSPLLAPPVLSDVDLDGDLDLVETPGTVMFNLGGGVFGPPQSYLPRATNAPWWDYYEVATSTLVDLDRDGDRDLVYGGLVFNNTTRQLARGSIPRPGRPASVDLYGTPGGAWFLFGSNGTTSFPFLPWGTVLIDPASAQLGAMGTFAATGPSAGTASFGVTVPNNPALVGSTSYWQAIDATQARFTNRLTITVMGY